MWLPYNGLPLDSSDTLNAEFLNRLVTNLNRSGGATVAGVGDLVYYGGDSSVDAPMKVLSPRSGANGSLVQVIAANTLGWTDVFASEYFDYLANYTTIYDGTASALKNVSDSYLKIYEGAVLDDPVVYSTSMQNSGANVRVGSTVLQGNYVPRVTTSTGIINSSRSMSFINGSVDVLNSLTARVFWVASTIKGGVYTGLLDVRNSDQVALPIDPLNYIIQNYASELSVTRVSLNELEALGTNVLDIPRFTAPSGNAALHNHVLVALFLLEKDINITIPLAPERISISSPSSRSIRITWTLDTSSGSTDVVTGFELRYRSYILSDGPHSTWQTVTLNDPSLRTYTISGVSINTSNNVSAANANVPRIFEVQIRSVNSAGSGELYASSWYTGFVEVRA